MGVIQLMQVKKVIKLHAPNAKEFYAKKKPIAIDR